MHEESAPSTAGAPDGDLFAGRYRLIRELGAGDRKRTYLAEDTILPRQVAVALVKPEAAGSDPQGTVREAEALCQTGNHDNIVTMYDRGTVEGTDYLVFEYLPGGNLRDLLAKRKQRRQPLTAEEVRRLGRQLARGLSHVHARGLLHRDLAPGNIWFDERDVAHLGDFDSAVPKDADHGDALPPTTEAYAAPEQLAGQPIDERSDLYSLGAVLYEAYSGESPRRAGKGAVVAPKALRPDMPPDLNAVICRLMAAQPADRPGSADQVLQELKPPFAQRRAEGLFPWAEGLPFPLAAILWHYDAEPDLRSKVDHLLNFFEALAEFRAIVLLSGFRSDRPFFGAHKPEWFGPDRGSRPIGLETPGIGTWLKVSERLSRTARSLLHDKDDAERCYGLFAAEDRELVDAITSSELTAILLEARDRRNAAAHGGIMSRPALEEELHSLTALLGKTQGLLLTAFETWTLLRPGSATYEDGIFDVIATLLTGTNPAFRKADVQVREPLDVRKLYLLNGASRHPLELIPLVRVVPGPKTGEDACYFYNRVEPGGKVRWVSYHSTADSEFTGDDPDVVKLLAEMSVPAAGSSTINAGKTDGAMTQ